MRLINTRTIELQAFKEDDIPEYAILSHTWDEEELSCHDFSDPKSTTLRGYKKIRACCRQARSEDYEFIWIDTVCIDKRSSTELSEAINSMYKWYKMAEVCYVYLSDVNIDKTILDQGKIVAESRWFTRGWTLQELIAPRRVVFLDSDLVELGTKVGMQSWITERTDIESKALLNKVDLQDICVGVKMSWAYDRQTTRSEDMAYALMGLFDVNMPMLYGEGENAFIRLQHEIIRLTNDHTILFWSAEEDLLWDGPLPGPLAHSLANFQWFKTNTGPFRTQSHANILLTNCCDPHCFKGLAQNSG